MHFIDCKNRTVLIHKLELMSLLYSIASYPLFLSQKTDLFMLIVKPCINKEKEKKKKRKKKKKEKKEKEKRKKKEGNYE